MGEKITFENGRICDFQGLVTLTLDRVIMHTVMHQSSTSTYIPNFIEIKDTFLWTNGRTDVRTYVRTFETHIIRSTLRSVIHTRRQNIKHLVYEEFDRYLVKLASPWMVLATRVRLREIRC